jgi:hypothetical protein
VKPDYPPNEVMDFATGLRIRLPGEEAFVTIDSAIKSGAGGWRLYVTRAPSPDPRRAAAIMLEQTSRDLDDLRALCADAVFDARLTMAKDGS